MKENSCLESDALCVCVCVCVCIYIYVYIVNRLLFMICI